MNRNLTISAHVGTKNKRQVVRPTNQEALIMVGRTSPKTSWENKYQELITKDVYKKHSKIGCAFLIDRFVQLGSWERRYSNYWKSIIAKGGRRPPRYSHLNTM